MAIKYCKEGFLGRYKHQELRWIVEGYFAGSFRQVHDDVRFEIFAATPNSQAKCGYSFTFAYEFPTTENMKKVLPDIVTDTRDMSAGKWHKLLDAIPSFENERFLLAPSIDTSFHNNPSSWR